MAYRRESVEAWNKWRAANESKLIPCGLPVTTLQDMKQWLFLLQEGWIAVGPFAGWRVELLSGKQATALHHLLTDAEFPHDWYVGLDVLNRIKVIAGLPNAGSQET